jgi:hypothetical protein
MKRGVLLVGLDANETTFSSTVSYVAPPNRGYEHTGHE